MSCLTQHKTKEELSDWLMNNASDNETTGFLDMLAGDIWGMMNAEEKLEEENQCDQDPTPEEARLLETMRKGFMGEIAKLQEKNKKLKKEHIQNIMKTKSIATELYREVKYALGYGEFDEPDRKVMYDEIKKLKGENMVLHNRVCQEETANTLLRNENKILKQKATAWDIINSGDWEYLRDLCDKEMCQELIACGECKEEDFEGYEGYEEEEEQ